MSTLTAAPAPTTRPSTPSADIGHIAVDRQITLRRMVVRNPEPDGVVLLLHGFPETLFVWKDIALALGDTFEVHAFDWPGYGLSSRPAADRFGYAPTDYARVLKAYIRAAGIDRSKLTIYATDIGALPALLLALDEPDIARSIIVGDFAPFNRPQHMWANLQALKGGPAAAQVRAYMNQTRDEILENVFYRGLPVRFGVAPELTADMARGWDHGEMTSADAFAHYYSHFTRDQEALEARLSNLRIPLKVVWGSDDLYIASEMGVEFAATADADLTILPGVGHFPHLQAPQATIKEIRAAV